MTETDAGHVLADLVARLYGGGRFCSGPRPVAVVPHPSLLGLGMARGLGGKRGRLYGVYLLGSGIGAVGRRRPSEQWWAWVDGTSWDAVTYHATAGDAVAFVVAGFEP